MTVRFEAAVAISRGLTPLAAEGRVVIEQVPDDAGTTEVRVSLLGPGGCLIVAAPVAAVRARAPWWGRGVAVGLVIHGVTYVVHLRTPPVAAGAAPAALAGALRGAARGLLAALASGRAAEPRQRGA